MRGEGTKPRRKRLRFVLILCLIGGALLATDAIQERLIRIAGRAFYGAEVFVRAPSFIGTFRAERIEIYDPYSDTSAPTLRMDDVAVAS
ncbi:MAG: hypothetical protein IIB38_11210, partial [Candidatus Hydrogenedentes bacterium]|nr:hypothetical protein [Candidatus Hydrogenedentota bacterium]